MQTRDVGVRVLAGLSMVFVFWIAACGPGKGKPGACAGSGACEIGTACGRDADCLFGACASGTCAEPAGPLPTGPVSATIAAAGGTIDVVTAEHVTLHLDFPAGAVSAPLAVSITPIAPAAGEWARVELRPSGVLLSKPATLRLTLPAAFPAIDGATLALLDGQTVAPLSKTARSGLTLSAELRALGVPTALTTQQPQHSTRFAVLDPGAIVLALPLRPEAIIAVADAVFTVLKALHHYRDAVELGTMMSTLAQRRESLGSKWISLVLPWEQKTQRAICEGLTASVQVVKASNPRCPLELKRVMRSALSWALPAFSIDPAITGVSCPAALDINSPDFYLTVLEAKSSEVVTKLERGVTSEWLACTCRETLPSQWTLAQKKDCPTRLAGMSRPDRAAADLLPDATAQSELDDSWAAIGKGEEQETAAGLDAAVAAEQQTLAAPVLAKLVDIAHATCRTGGNPASVGRLLLRAPGNTAAVADAQLCASPLSVQVAGVAGSLASLGPGDKPDNAVTSGSLSAGTLDNLQLSGPIAALRCVTLQEDPETVEADQLVVSAASASGDVEVARQQPDTQGTFLATPLPVSVKSLLQAAGLDPQTATGVELHVSRESPRCGGLYGAAGSARLFTVTVTIAGCRPAAGSSYCIAAVPGVVTNSRVVNSAGQVAFTTLDGHAAIFKDGNTTPLPDPPGALPKTVGAYAINELGHVTGGYTANRSNGSNTAVVLWRDGTVVDLGVGPSGRFAGSFGVNDADQIAAIYTLEQFIGGSQFETSTAARIDAGAWTALGSATGCSGPTPTFCPSSTPSGIDSAGNVVGDRNPAYLHRLPVLWPASGGEQFLALPAGAIGGQARSISSHGTIAGYAFVANGTAHAVVWGAAGLTDLGPGVAYGVNDAGLIVGTIGGVATLWKDGVATDLHTLVPAGTPVFSEAVAISEAGHVVVNTNTPDPTTQLREVFLLTPSGK